jgi:dethiobiotin synthetase
MPKGFFVTGTDTNVGKTVLSSLLCAALRGVYWKPIQTGSREGTDRQTVIGLAGIDVADALPEVYVFDDPVSPHLAADRARCEISLERINLPPGNGERPLIVEGAGGVMVPINRHQFMMDLMRQVGLPVILAARSTLGTINHTLLSIRCLESAQIRLHGVVLIGPENLENKQAIERYSGKQVIGQIPPLENIDRASLQNVFSRHFIQEAFA